MWVKTGVPIALSVLALPACIGPVAETYAVPNAAYELVDSDSIEMAAAKVLQGMIDDIGAIKDRFPELSGWDGEQVRRRAEDPGSNGFRYSFRHTAFVKRDPVFGRYGCSLHVHIVRDEMPRQTRVYTAEESRVFEEMELRKRTVRMVPSIRGYVCAEVRVGRKHSDGFVESIGAIFARHLDRLGNFDARKANGQQRPPPPRKPRGHRPAGLRSP
jgi:hypothetical protein